MNKLIICTGVGLGHSTREHAIAKYLKGKIFIAGYNCSYNYFKNIYPTIKISGLRLPDKQGKMLFKRLFIPKNLFLPFLWNIDYLRLKSLVKKNNISVIISDNEPIAKKLSKNTGAKVVFIHNQNPDGLGDIIEGDFNKDMKRFARLTKSLVEWGHRHADLVIAPSLIGASYIKNKFHSLNPIVRPPKKAIKNNSILVMLGGSKFGMSLAKTIIKLSGEMNEKFIIFGYTKNMKRRNLQTFKFNPDFIDYLQDAKAVITLAGHSALSECLIYKKPALVFPIENHVEQYLNARAIERIFPVLYTTPKKSRLKKAIISLLKNSKAIEENIKKLKLRNDAKLAAELINNI